MRTHSPLALAHNDRSPLENMHCSALYELLGDPALDVDVIGGSLPLLPTSSVGSSSGANNCNSPQWREARKVIITAILGTDMSHHFEQVQ